MTVDDIGGGGVACLQCVSNKPVQWALLHISGAQILGTFGITFFTAENVEPEKVKMCGQSILMYLCSDAHAPFIIFLVNPMCPQTERLRYVVNGPLYRFI